MKNSEKMKNTGDNYLKFPKKPVKLHEKIRKNIFKSEFLRINASPLIDYNHGLLIIHSPISHIYKAKNSRPNCFNFSNPQNRKLLLVSRKFQKNCKSEQLC